MASISASSRTLGRRSAGGRSSAGTTASGSTPSEGSTRSAAASASDVAGTATAARRHPGAEQSLALARGRRCGFFAESPDRESEGCSASIELGDYRDYTTYFIAGLTGRDRFGRAIPKAVDRDADGRVTPFDAHLHTLIEGYNSDLPRSTSEDYLERALPWYQRWIGTSQLPDNVYGRLAREMAAQYGLPRDGRALGRVLRQQYDSLQGEVDRVTGRVAELEATATEARESIRGRLERTWPSLAHPYTDAFRVLLTAEPGPVEAAIRADTSYRGLVAQQEQLAAYDVQLIDLDRRISRLDRLRRARLMARSLAQLERHGAREVRASYDQLRQCESLPLTEK